MKNMEFSKKSLIAIFAMVMSCKRDLESPLTLNQKYLVSMVNRRKDIGAREFLKGLPEPEKDKVFKDIAKFAKKIGVEEITADLIWMYFGEDFHVRKVLNDIRRNKDLNSLITSKKSRFIVDHVAKVVEIIRVKKGKVRAKYQNGNISIILEGLRPMCKIQGLKKGKKVLVHFSSIVTHRISKDVVKYLKERQAKNKELMKACRNIRLIDYSESMDIGCK
jgi:hypothetical protein